MLVLGARDMPRAARGRQPRAAVRGAHGPDRVAQIAAGGGMRDAALCCMKTVLVIAFLALGPALADVVPARLPEQIALAPSSQETVAMRGPIAAAGERDSAAPCVK
jgi:hypothetical protein